MFLGFVGVGLLSLQTDLFSLSRGPGEVFRGGMLVGEIGVCINLFILCYCDI